MRLDRLTQLVVETAASWSMAPVVAAYQAMRGVAFMTAVTFVVEIGDVRRFDNPRQLMAYLGLVLSESSTGERVKRGGITKAGNTRVRRVLIEGAWTYRFPARVSPTIQTRLEGLPRTVREIAWRGQVRLCARYRKLMAAGKPKVVAVTAIAREMAAFLWAIGQEVAPTAKVQSLSSVQSATERGPAFDTSTERAIAWEPGPMAFKLGCIRTRRSSHSPPRWHASSGSF